MLRIYNDDKYVGSINDDLCICVHESRGSEPIEYIILTNDNNIYLGRYPRIQGHRPHGEKISIKDAESLLDEAYCDEREYQKLKAEYDGIDLIKRLINS